MSTLYLCGSCGCGEAYHQRGKGKRCRVPGCDGCSGWVPVEDTYGNHEEGPWEALESTNGSLPMATYQESPRVEPEGIQGPSQGCDCKTLAWGPEGKWTPAQKKFVGELKAKLKKDYWAKNARDVNKASRRSREQEQDRILALLLKHGFVEAAKVVAETCIGVEVVPTDIAIKGVA